MTERICTRCGIRGGTYSVFEKGMCESCRQHVASVRDTRTAVVHVVLFVAGVSVFVGGVEGFLEHIIFAMALFDVLGFAITAIHEFAHAVVCLATRFRLREVSIGIGPRITTATIGGTRLVLRMYPVSGLTSFTPVGRATRSRMMIVTLAGPLSHLPLAWATVKLLPDSVLWQMYRPGAIGFVLGLGLLNLVPLGNTDGRNLVSMLLMPDHDLSRASKLATAMDTVARLQEVERGVTEARLQDREPFLAHLSDPTITPRERALSLNNLAVTDLYLGDPSLLKEADDATAESMQLLPDLPAVRNTRGAVLVALGRDQEGIDLMEPTLVAVAPSHRASSHASLALAHARQGRVFEARRHIASAIRLEHRFPLLEEAMILAGAMETAVVRGYLERWSPEQAVHEIRRDAGEAAAALGLALRAHIEATGRDHDLVPVAEALVP